MLSGFITESGNYSSLDPKFKMRVETVSAFLKSKGYDVETTIDSGIKAFLEANRYQSDYVEGRSPFHEIGHLAGCATSGSISDEIRALIFEIAFNDGLYSQKNPKDFSVHTYAPDKKGLKQKQIISQSIASHFSRYAEASGYLLTKTLQAFLNVCKNTLIPFGQKAEKRAIDEYWAYKIKQADSSVSAEEREKLANRAYLQNQFFLAITGGRALHNLSSHELVNLPLASLGVQFNHAANDNSELFSFIPDEDLVELTDAIKTLEFAA